MSRKTVVILLSLSTWLGLMDAFLWATMDQLHRNTRPFIIVFGILCGVSVALAKRALGK